jgi:hypothetical protein
VYEASVQFFANTGWTTDEDFSVRIGNPRKFFQQLSVGQAAAN